MCALAGRGSAQDGGGEDVPRGLMVGTTELCGGWETTIGVLAMFLISSYKVGG